MKSPESPGDRAPPAPNTGSSVLYSTVDSVRRMANFLKRILEPSEEDAFDHLTGMEKPRISIFEGLSPEPVILSFHLPHTRREELGSELLVDSFEQYKQMNE
ncbi:unnamed protein product [Coccothraustes coccothraustes]